MGWPTEFRGKGLKKIGCDTTGHLAVCNKVQQTHLRITYRVKGL